MARWTHSRRPMWLSLGRRTCGGRRLRAGKRPDQTRSCRPQQRVCTFHGKPLNSWNENGVWYKNNNKIDLCCCVDNDLKGSREKNERWVQGREEGGEGRGAQWFMGVRWVCAPEDWQAVPGDMCECEENGPRKASRLMVWTTRKMKPPFPEWGDSRGTSMRRRSGTPF